MNVSAFTTICNGITNRLINEAKIISNGEEMYTKFAQWDTGATMTCISQAVIDRLSLIPIGQSMVNTPSGQRVLDQYIVDVLLRNNVLVKDVVVLGSEIGNQGIDVLIGMDIINLGDFVISNYDGKTHFSFQIPSQRHLDFVVIQQPNSHK